MTEITNRDISDALLFCISDCGDYCNMCPYAQFGSSCSKKLLRDASNKIKELTEKEKYTNA